MCCESSDVVRFDLGPLLQGQTRIAKLKSAYNSLIIDPSLYLDYQHTKFVFLVPAHPVTSLY